MKPDKKLKKQRQASPPGLAVETKQSIIAVAFFALALLTVLAYFSRAGRVGALVAGGLTSLFGKLYFFFRGEERDFFDLRQINPHRSFI